MKQYLVIIKRISEVRMTVSEKSKNKAINKVRSFIDNCIDNDMSVDDMFDEKPIFKYHAYREKIERKSRV